MVLNNSNLRSGRLNFNNPKPTTPKPVTAPPKTTQPVISPTSTRTMPNTPSKVNALTQAKSLNATYGMGNPAPGYSDDDYRTPVQGVYVPGLAPKNTAYKANEALKGTTNDYTYQPAQPAQPAQPTDSPFDMGQFTGLFDKYNADNTSRFTALEKMIQDLINGNKYTASQQQGVPSNQGVYDGSHIFTAPNQGKEVGYTQNNDVMNDTLYKYLNGMWKGGF